MSSAALPRLGSSCFDHDLLSTRTSPASQARTSARPRHLRGGSARDVRRQRRGARWHGWARRQPAVSPMTLEAPRVLAQNSSHRRDERNQPDGPGASTCRPRRSEPRRPRGARHRTRGRGAHRLGCHRHHLVPSGRGHPCPTTFPLGVAPRRMGSSSSCTTPARGRWSCCSTAFRLAYSWRHQVPALTASCRIVWSSGVEAHETGFGHSCVPCRRCRRDDGPPVSSHTGEVRPAGTSRFAGSWRAHSTGWWLSDERHR